MKKPTYAAVAQRNAPAEKGQLGWAQPAAADIPSAVRASPRQRRARGGRARHHKYQQQQQQQQHGEEGDELGEWDHDDDKAAALAAWTSRPAADGVGAWPAAQPDVELLPADWDNWSELYDWTQWSGPADAEPGWAWTWMTREEEAAHEWRRVVEDEWSVPGAQYNALRGLWEGVAGVDAWLMRSLVHDQGQLQLHRRFVGDACGGDAFEEALTHGRWAALVLETWSPDAEKAPEAGDAAWQAPSWWALSSLGNNVWQTWSPDQVQKLVAAEHGGDPWTKPSWWKDW